MRKQYRERKGETCKYCCNYQKCASADGAEKICIAYSDEIIWNPEEEACGLFNVPFRGLRPEREKLECMFDKSKKKTDQFSLF